MVYRQWMVRTVAHLGVGECLKCAADERAFERRDLNPVTVAMPYLQTADPRSRANARWLSAGSRKQAISIVRAGSVIRALTDGGLMAMRT